MTAAEEPTPVAPPPTPAPSTARNAADEGAGAVDPEEEGGANPFDAAPPAPPRRAAASVAPGEGGAGATTVTTTTTTTTATSPMPPTAPTTPPSSPSDADAVPASNADATTPAPPPAAVSSVAPDDAATGTITTTTVVTTSAPVALPPVPPTSARRGEGDGTAGATATTLAWFGHACFTLTFSFPDYAPYVVAVDPFGPGLGYPPPKLRADAVFLTHEHADHNALAQVEPRAGEWSDLPNLPVAWAEPGQPEKRLRRSFLLRGLNPDGTVNETRPAPDAPAWRSHRWLAAERPEGFAAPVRPSRLGPGLQVDVVPALHYADDKDRRRGAVALFRWTPVWPGNTSFPPGNDPPTRFAPSSVPSPATPAVVHLGDLGQDRLTDEQVARLKPVDILLVPVGGHFTLDPERAARVVGQLEPRVVVPMHYQTAALDMGEVALAGIDAFLGVLPVAYERRPLAANAFDWPVAELEEADRRRAADPAQPVKRLVVVPDWHAAATSEQ